MLNAAIEAAAAVLSRPLRSVFWRSLGLTLALLALLWIAAQATIRALLPAMPDSWTFAVDLLSGIGLFVGLGFLVAPVTAIFAGLFLDEVAEAVEAVHYPADPPGRPMAFLPGLWAAARFAALVLAVNAVLLVLMLLPGVNLPLFFVANAYLLGREYFEFVALRHMTEDEMRALRAREGTRLFLAGLAMALVLAIPIVNLVAPLYSTALMVHVFKAERRRRSAV